MKNTDCLHSAFFRARRSGSCPSAGFIAWRLIPLMFCLALPLAALAVTHAMLLNDSKMNAKRFADYFEDFSFKYHHEIQPVDRFLKTESGDCDDYAALADEVLKHRDFQTILIHVQLDGMLAHDVCYVEQNKAYLDYNNRNVFFTLSHCRDSLRTIATKVARSFDVDWTYASMYTFSYETGVKRMLVTIARTDTTDQVGMPAVPPVSRIIVLVQ